MSNSRHVALACIILMSLPFLIVEAGGEQKDGPAPLEIRLPPEIPSEQVQLFYDLTGPFGTHIGLVKAEPERNSYLIDTFVNHQAAETLKVMLYASGCQIVTFTVTPLQDSERERDVTCEDLPPMTFNGRVEFPEALRRRPYDVDVKYVAFWGYDFFHISGEAEMAFHLARVTPDERGAFQFQLPNFSKDAVTESYHRKAWIRFVAVERDTGNFVCLLSPANVHGKEFTNDLPIKSKYPNEVVFKPGADDHSGKEDVGVKPQDTH